MKRNFHPQIYTDAVITCVCGNSFVTTSTKKAITVEICNACHPFYTGQQRFVDTEGRIDKFAKKLKVSEEKKAKIRARKASKAAKVPERTQKTAAKTLKDLLQKAREDKA